MGTIEIRSERTNRLEAIVDRWAEEALFSGAVLVKDSGGELLATARGLAHRGFSVPNTVDTRFDTASLGKLFTSAAAFRLMDRGLLGLDERIGDIIDLSGTRIPADVTLGHCLSHSSGIADDADEEAGEEYEAIWREKPCYVIRKTADFLDQFAHKEALFPAGSRSRYNNCAYILAGLAMEARSGLAFRDLVEAEVLRPAGLARSAYLEKDGVDAGVAEGYATVENEGGEAVGFRKNIYAFPPVGSPDAGILTTVRDLAAFFEAFEGDGGQAGALLSPASRALFLGSRIDAFGLPGGGLRRYGYGLEHDYDASGGRVRYGKDGCNPGVAAIAMRYAIDNGFVAILSNQDSDVWALCRALAAEAGFAG